MAQVNTGKANWAVLRSNQLDKTFNVLSVGLQVEGGGGVLPSVIDWQWAGSTLRSLAQLYMNYPTIMATLLPELGMHKSVVQQARALPLLMYGCSMRDTSGVLNRAKKQTQHPGIVFSFQKIMQHARLPPNAHPHRHAFLQGVEQGVFLGQRLHGTAEGVAKAAVAQNTAIWHDVDSCMKTDGLSKHLHSCILARPPLMQRICRVTGSAPWDAQRHGIATETLHVPLAAQQFYY